MYNIELWPRAILALAVFVNVLFFPQKSISWVGGHAAAHPRLRVQFTDWNMVASIGGFFSACLRSCRHCDCPVCARGGKKATAEVWEGYASHRSRVDATVSGALSQLQHAPDVK